MGGSKVVQTRYIGWFEYRILYIVYFNSIEQYYHLKGYYFGLLSMRYFRIYNTQCRMAVSSLTAGERTVCVQARSDTLQPNIPSTLPYEVLRSSLVVIPHMDIHIPGLLGGAVANALVCCVYCRGFNPRRKPVINLRFDQIKRPGQHVN